MNSADQLAVNVRSVRDGVTHRDVAQARRPCTPLPQEQVIKRAGGLGKVGPKNVRRKVDKESAAGGDIRVKCAQMHEPGPQHLQGSSQLRHHSRASGPGIGEPLSLLLDVAECPQPSLDRAGGGVQVKDKIRVDGVVGRRRT